MDLLRCGRLLPTLACATPARKDKECAWTAVPEVDRQALLNAYGDRGSDGLRAVQIGDSIIRGVGVRCGSG